MYVITLAFDSLVFVGGIFEFTMPNCDISQRTKSSKRTIKSRVLIISKSFSNQYGMQINLSIAKVGLKKTN